MKYAFIKDHRDEFDVLLMCSVLGASRSGYYDWLSRDLSTKQDKLEQLKATMGAIFKKSRQCYGTPRMLKALIAMGYSIG